MTDAQARQARRYASDLESLVSGREEATAGLLGPLAAFLREVAGPEPFDRPGTYEVAVYCEDDSYLTSTLAGVWTGHAANRRDARRLALEEYEDQRIHGWWAKVLDGYEDEGEDDDGRDEGDDRSI